MDYLKQLLWAEMEKYEKLKNLSDGPSLKGYYLGVHLGLEKAVNFVQMTEQMKS